MDSLILIGSIRRTIKKGLKLEMKHRDFVAGMQGRKHYYSREILKISNPQKVPQNSIYFVNGHRYQSLRVQLENEEVNPTLTSYCKDYIIPLQFPRRI